MPNKVHNVPLPIDAPTTEALRDAIAAIIRDITTERGLTDLEFAGKLNVHPNTVAAWRNKKNDMGALMVAIVGAKFGAKFIAPYHALYGAHAHGLVACDAAPLGELTDALSALVHGIGPKARLDSLPVLKDAADALGAYIVSLEQFRRAA